MTLISKQARIDQSLYAHYIYIYMLVINIELSFNLLQVGIELSHNDPWGTKDLFLIGW